MKIGFREEELKLIRECLGIITPVRREITGVGLGLTLAGIIRGFCLQRFCADGVLITENKENLKT
jgi:hypothetical protein